MKYGLDIFRFVILLFVVFLCIISVAVLCLYDSSVSHKNDDVILMEKNEEGFFYNVLSTSNSVDFSRGMIRSNKEVKFDEDQDFISFSEENENIMISKLFSSNMEYQCTGNCYCDDERRRNIGASNTLLRKGMTFLISSASVILAANRAHRYFEEECHISFGEECESGISADVESCDQVSMKTESSGSQSTSKKKSVLFVCWANICRSPMCECIFGEKQKEAKSDWEFDSCGTHGQYFTGQLPDENTLRVLKDRLGVDFESHARGIEPEDFKKFDYILCMDDKNYQDCINLGKEVKFEKGEKAAKLRKLTDFSDKYGTVPDPYKGGLAGFENVFRICSECCDEFLRQAEDEKEEE